VKTSRGSPSARRAEARWVLGPPYCKFQTTPEGLGETSPHHPEKIYKSLKNPSKNGSLHTFRLPPHPRPSPLPVGAPEGPIKKGNMIEQYSCSGYTRMGVWESG
jgi:hypothetical protein